MSHDFFSTQADFYAKYRPSYPKDLIDYILGFVEEKNTAWDCATGNGQAAILLADHFKNVVATDISLSQLNHAVAKENIAYSLSPAESTLFAKNSFDLITIAQAYHWIDQKAFEKEARRVAKNNAVIAVWMYEMFITDNTALNKLMDYYHYEITGPYWHENRKYVDEKYETVYFNFEKLPVKEFSIKETWNREQIEGYLSSWSSVQKFIEVNDYSPLTLIKKELNEILPGNQTLDIRFPLHLKLGRIVK
jgi:ubiquinone/menaquinone biosynthesis C-methylase UbiE